MAICQKTSNPVLNISIMINEEVPAYRFIGFDGNLCEFDAKAIGVSNVEWEKDDFASVTVLGIMPVEAGEAISAGAVITSDGSGKAVNSTLDSLTNGYALESASNAGEFIRVLLA